MRSHTSAVIANTVHHLLPILRSRNGLSPLRPLLARVSFDSGNFGGLESYAYLKVVFGSGMRQLGCCLQRKEGSVGVSSFSDWGDTDGAVECAFSSSEGEDSDSDSDMMLQPITDVDLPTTKEHFHPIDDSITLAAHRLATLGRAQKKRK